MHSQSCEEKYINDFEYCENRSSNEKTNGSSDVTWRKKMSCLLSCNFFLTNAKRTTSIVMQLWDCEFTFSCQHFLSWIQSLGIDLLWNGSKKYVNFVQLSAYRMVTTICCHDSSVCGSRTRVSSWPRSPVMLSNGWIEFVKWKISYNSFIANISHNQNSSF